MMSRGALSILLTQGRGVKFYTAYKWIYFMLLIIQKHTWFPKSIPKKSVPICFQLGQTIEYRLITKGCRIYVNLAKTT